MKTKTPTKPTAKRATAKSKPEPTVDTVNHPPHYNQGNVECIEAIESMLGPQGFVAYLRGQIVKYNWRLLHKGNSLEDTRKLIWYANLLESRLTA